jgi:hypothetical protein
MDPMTATIHFIGLALFITFNPFAQLQRTATTSTSLNQARVLAIMPAVNGPAANGPAQTRHNLLARQANDSIPVDLPSPVEKHIAALVFDHCSLLAVSGWEVKQLNAQYSYIELHGDLISFAADAETTPASLTNSNLGHLGGPQLAAGYQPPLYSDAAAVFDIPRGTVSACKSITSDNSGQTINRYDTKLKLKNHGTITITANGSKSATLVGDAKIAAANVPPVWLTSHTASPGGGTPHYMVYCAMTGASPCDNDALLPSSNVQIDPCDDAIEIILHPPSSGDNTSTQTNKQQHGGTSTQSSDLFCSTTSWP